VRIEGSDSWIIEADEMRRLPCVDPENRELLLSMGAFVENMALAAGTVGLGTDIQVIARDATEREMVRAVLYENRPTRYPLQRITQRRTVKHGQLPKELTAVDVRALSESMRGHLFYFPRGSNHAACMRDAAVDNYRIQAERDDAQRELVRWLRLNNQTARRHRDGLSTEGFRDRHYGQQGAWPAGAPHPHREQPTAGLSGLALSGPGLQTGTALYLTQNR
jgi:hypothetical protein